MEQLALQYAPIILVILILLLQSRLFVTPTELEVKHRQILDDCDRRYSSKNEAVNIKADIEELKEMVQEMYKKLMH